MTDDFVCIPLISDDIIVPLEPDYDGGCTFMYRLI